MPRGYNLTPEKILLINKMAVQGVSDQLISKNLNISFNTIRTHTSNFWKERMLNKETV